MLQARQDDLEIIMLNVLCYIFWRAFLFTLMDSVQYYVYSSVRAVTDLREIVWRGVSLPRRVLNFVSGAELSLWLLNTVETRRDVCFRSLTSNVTESVVSVVGYILHIATDKQNTLSLSLSHTHTHTHNHPHTRMHACIHPYIHTYIYIYIRGQKLKSLFMSCLNQLYVYVISHTLLLGILTVEFVLCHSWLPTPITGLKKCAVFDITHTFWVLVL